MALPIPISKILDKNVVESDRIEFKRAWNPEPILHSVCAFANDIDNCGGGYIIVGIEERSDGEPEIIGVDRGSVDGLNKALLDLCNRISPRYLAETDYVEYEGKGLFVIWVPGGRTRPYKCPLSLSEKRSDNGYYIRRLASTIRANNSEERELFSVSEDVPFDDRICNKASIADIQPTLIQSFLQRTGSRMAKDVFSAPLEEVLLKMNLLDGPPENRRPVNVAHLFFNDHPEDVFPFTRIEVVYKPDPTGRDMEEKIFNGPIDRQIIDSVRYVSNTYLKERIIKSEDRPEARRVWNYPVSALEEAITNAVYHRDYQKHEPVTVTVFPDRIEVTSVPGPFRSISGDDLLNRRMISKTYRNRRIGEFLKELGLAERRNTGVPLMVESMAENGSDLPVFETDEDRTYLTVILPVNRVFLSETVTATPVKEGRRTREQITQCIIAILSEGECSLKDIASRMGYNGVPTSLKNVVTVLLSDGTLEYTMPYARSSKQKLRLRHR